jgi:hypothetical protein
LVLEPQCEWLRLHSLRAECLFWLGDFERAESVFEAASRSRNEAGLRDWDYIRQRRYLALSKRGLCDFSGCVAVLKEARSIAGERGLTELITHLEDDIKTTELIRRGDFHDVAFAAQKITLVGRNGVEILGDDRIPLQNSETLSYACTISQCRFVMEDPFRMRVQLRFSVNNEVPVSNGPISDGYPGSRTPILFGFLLPNGAAVHYGDFSLNLNHPDLDWKEKFFFLQNQFATVFHPESYPPNGFHPIPRCKTYMYVRGDFCFFRSHLPRKAEVSFAGTISYPARWARQAPGSVELAAAILLPYRRNSFASVQTACSVQGLRGVQTTIARTAYLADRVNYSPGVTPLAPEEGLAVGQSTALDSTECEVHGCALTVSELLTVTLSARLDRDLAVCLQHQAHVIPTGTFDYIQRPQRRNPGGGISLADDTVEPIPLLRCVLLNTQPRARSVELATSSHDLFPPTRQDVDVPAGGIAVVNIKPRIGD